MQISDVENYATQLFDQMGPKAIAHAAQKARDCEAEGDETAAGTWRKVEQALLEKRGPHQG